MAVTVHGAGLCPWDTYNGCSAACVILGAAAKLAVCIVMYTLACMALCTLHDQRHNPLTSADRATTVLLDMLAASVASLLPCAWLPAAPVRLQM